MSSSAEAATPSATPPPNNNNNSNNSNNTNNNSTSTTTTTTTTNASVEEWKRRANEKRMLRATNLKASTTNRPDSNLLLKLDSNVKKNGQLVKRIRTLHELPKDSKRNIVKDLEKQNLRRYVEEILSALTTLPLTNDSSPYILLILSHFHERYCDLRDFFPQLVKSCVPTDVTKGLDLMRFSAVLNLVGGCVELAICPVDTLINMLRGMIAKTQDKKPKACVSVILNFLEQYGDVFMDVPIDRMKQILGVGSMVKKEDNDSVSSSSVSNGGSSGGSSGGGGDEDGDEVVTQNGGSGSSDNDATSSSSSHTSANGAVFECDYKAFVKSDERIVSASEMKQFQDILVPFFKLLCSKLLQEHESLTQLEREKHDKLTGVHHRSGSDQDSTTTTTAPTSSSIATSATSSYDTYSAKVKKWDKTFRDTKLLGMYLNMEMPEQVLEGTQRIKAMEVEQQKEKGYVNIVVSAFDDDELPFYTMIPNIFETGDRQQQQGNELSASSSSSSLSSMNQQQQHHHQHHHDDNESLFGQLPNLTQSQVEQFCRRYHAKFGYSKTMKRKLVKHLFGVKRTSLELLPLYAKIVKILEPEGGGELSEQLTSSLKAEFEKLFSERDQIKIESKIKNMRFMCELVKFRVMDPHVILSYLKQCLNEFRHHNIDVACACIENCGRYLMASDDESVSTVVKQLVDKMWRLKCVKSLEERYETMVENAYFSLYARSENQTLGSDTDFVGKITNPLLLYIRHLLLNLDVGPNEKMINKCSDIVKQLRKLPYNSQPDLPEKIANIVMILDSKYENLSALASVISALGRYRQRVLVLVIDALLERIRWNLAHGDQFCRQQGIKDMKFLAELYNYHGVDLNVIEDVWFMCISYARWTNDTPFECYRIQLICESLITVNRCITDSVDKKRVDRFLLYFQRYVLGKGIRLPVHVEFLLADTLDIVKPNLLWPKSFAEACDRVRTIEQRRKIQWPGEFLPNFTVDVAQLDAFDSTGRWVLKEQSEKLWPIEPEKFRNYTLETNTEDNKDDSDSEDESSNSESGSDAVRMMQQQVLQSEEVARKRKQRQEEMEFEKEFQQMLNESVSERKKERSTGGQKLLRVEELLKNLQSVSQPSTPQPPSTPPSASTSKSTPPNETYFDLHENGGDVGGAEEEEERAPPKPTPPQPFNGVKMLVLMRKGKQKMREMDVPIDSYLANRALDTRQQTLKQEEMENEQEAKRVILMNMKNRRDT